MVNSSVKSAAPYDLYQCKTANLVCNIPEHSVDALYPDAHTLFTSGWRYAAPCDEQGRNQRLKHGSYDRKAWKASQFDENHLSTSLPSQHRPHDQGCGLN